MTTPRRHQAEVLPTHTPALFAAAVGRAAQMLREGEVVALPTETVYGLAANALDPVAVARIFQIKGRPANNPVIVHVASLEMALRCVNDWPAAAEQLARSFWPGPLTLVLPRSRAVPDLVTAGGETVGVRWPSPPFIQAIIRACDFPLAAPSANLSGHVSPTNAQHVLTSLGDRILLIVDGGQSQVGIESTVLDLTVDPLRVLRPGMIHAESLLAATAECGVRSAECGMMEAAARSLRSPGLLPKHYAPKAKLLLWSWRDEAGLCARLSTINHRPSTIHIIAHTHIPLAADLGRVCVIPHDPEAFARALYAELHRCDEEGAELIIVEAVPDAAAWQGIADRLRRAAG